MIAGPYGDVRFVFSDEVRDFEVFYARAKDRRGYEAHVGRRMEPFVSAYVRALTHGNSVSGMTARLEQELVRAWNSYHAQMGAG